MTLQQIVFVIVPVLITSLSNAQTSADINYSDSSSLTVNGLAINSLTNVRALTKKIGEPGKIIDYPNKEKSYFYEDAGFIIMVKDSIVKGLGINYSWDGDKKFPQKSFTGHLTIGELTVTKETKAENISAIKSIEFGCPVSILCASKSRMANVRCTIAFDPNLLTQVVFLLK